MPIIDIPNPHLVEKCKTLVEFHKQRKIKEYSINAKPSPIIVEAPCNDGKTAMEISALHLTEDSNDCHNLCRLCLEESDTLSKPFRIKYADLAFRYLKIHVTDSNKSVPWSICTACTEQLTKFDTYLKRCTTQQEKLINVDKPGFKTTGASNEPQELDVRISNKVVVRKPNVIKPKVIYRCTICNRNYCSQKDLDDHHFIYHTKPKKRTKTVLPCDYCGKLFQKNQLRSHICRTHIVKKFKCNICDKAYATLGLLATHKNVAHTQSGPCPKCGKVLTKRGLEEHVKMCGKDIEDILVQCELCPMKLKSYKKYLRHKLVVHERKANFTCRYCSKEFFRKDTHREHEAMHRGDQNKVCEWCGKKFTYNTNYYTHVNKKHSAEYKQMQEEKERERERKLLMESTVVKEDYEVVEV